MSAHPGIEELVVTSLDAPLSGRDGVVLHDHLEECVDCRDLAAAYRADASRLRAIAFQTPPDRIRAAIRADDVRPRAVRTRWLAIAAVIALLVALLASAAGSALRRQTLTVTPLGQVEWLTPDDALRLVGAAAVEGGWLLATADESFTRTMIHVWRPDAGWTAEEAVDEFAPDPGALTGAGIQSPTMSAFVACCTDQRLVYTRDRVGRWQRFELADVGSIYDVAASGENVWVLGEAMDDPGSGDGGLAIASSRAGFAPIVVPSEVRGRQVSRLAVTSDRLVVAGCSSLEPDACRLVIYSSRLDGQAWTKADLPRSVDLRTPVSVAIPALPDPTMLPPQVVARDDAFATIVPTDAGRTEIWGSADGLDWHVEATFESPPYPAFLGGDGTNVVATGGSADEMWIWIPTDRGEWIAHLVDLGRARPGGVVLAGDRLYALGISETTVDGWQLDVGR